MIRVNIHEAKTHLSSYLEKVAKGETVVLCRRNVPLAEIRTVQKQLTGERPIGLAGEEYKDFEIPEEFFNPLPDDIENAFSGQVIEE